MYIYLSKGSCNSRKKKGSIICSIVAIVVGASPPLVIQPPLPDRRSTLDAILIRILSSIRSSYRQYSYKYHH